MFWNEFAVLLPLIHGHHQPLWRLPAVRSHGGTARLKPPTPLVLPSEARSSRVPGLAAGSGPNLPWAPLPHFTPCTCQPSKTSARCFPETPCTPPPRFKQALLDRLLRESSSSTPCLGLCEPKVRDVRPADPAVGKRRHQPFKGHCDVTPDRRQPPEYPPRPPSSAPPPPRPAMRRGPQCQACINCTYPGLAVAVHNVQGWRGERRALSLPLQDLLPQRWPHPAGTLPPVPCSADLPTLHPTPWRRSQDTLVSPEPDHAGSYLTPRAGQ